METKRLIWLDNLKSLLIVLVVLGHCLQATISDFQNDVLFRYIYSFHMPLFIFISGYASYKINIEWSIISRRFIQLIIPFIVWTCLSTKMTFVDILEIIFKPEKGLWFLWALFFISLINVLTIKFAKFINMREEIAIFIISFILVISMNYIRLFAYPTIAKFYLFYVLGFYSRKYFSVISYEKEIAIVSFFSYIVLAYFCMQGQPPSFMPQGSSMNYNKIYNTIVAIVAIIAFILIFKNWIVNDFGWLTTMGRRNTLGIYAVHRIILGLLPIRLVSYENRVCYYIFIIIICLLVSVLSSICVTLFDKNRVFALLLNGHYKK